MSVTMIVLRLIHIFAGVFWAGSVFVTAAYMIPAVRATGPAGGQFMRQLVRARYPIAVASAAIVTILAGLALYWRDSVVSSGAWARSPAAMVYGIGALAAIIALHPGIAMVTVTAFKLARLGDEIQASGAPPTAEQSARLGAMQRRMVLGARWAAGLVAIAVIAMAIARYV